MAGNASQRPVRLDVIAGDPLRTIEIAPGASIVVGRDDACDLQLRHDGVSRRHCSLSFREDGLVVVDLGSTHGTDVDGVRIVPRLDVPLRHGAALGIGPWIFRVRIHVRDDAPVSLLGAAVRERPSYETRPTIFLRLRDDDTRARELSWQEFRERYAPVIVGFARNAGLVGAEADDLLQDVLLAFFRVSPRFEYDPAKGRFRGYLKRAVLNEVRRRGHRNQRAPSALEFDPADDATPDEEHSWEREWAEQVMRRALDDARKHVDPRTFEAFELYVQRGVPAEDVAARLGLAVNSVHQAKSRVLRLAREAAEAIREAEG